MIIQHHWNKATRQNYPPKSRDYISFSDLGKPFIDRYWKMKGEPVTNDFDDRVLRIFDAGRVIEFIVLRALAMAGILNQKQQYVELAPNENQLKVLGYLDCTIGGFADWDKARSAILRHLEEYKLKLDDQLLEQKAIGIIDGLKSEYPDGKVPEMLVEVKSVNSMAFWAHKNRDSEGNFKGYDHNKLQLYGYMKATGIKKGILLYVSKDDFTVQELGLVLGNTELESLLNQDIETMTGYFKRDEVPPAEQLIVHNPNKQTFELNWKVKRSSYLTKIYGYKNQDEVEDKNHQTILDINRALKHLRENKVKDEDKTVIEDYGLQKYVKLSIYK